MSKKSKWRLVATAKRDTEQVAASASDDQSDRDEPQYSERIEQAQRRIFYDNAHDQLLNEAAGQGNNNSNSNNNSNINHDEDDNDNDREHNEYQRLIDTDLHEPEFRRAKSLARSSGPYFNEQMNKMTRRQATLLILAVALIGACGLLLMLSRLPPNQLERRLEDAHHDNYGEDETRYREQFQEGHQETRWLVSTPKCHIPLLEPWDKSIEGFVSRKSPMNCTALLDEIVSGRDPSKPNNWTGLRPSSMSYVESNRLYFTELALEWGALASGHKAGKCCFKRVTRLTADDNQLEQGPCEPIPSQGLSVDSSIIEVICATWNYTNVHSFVVHNQAEEEALLRVGREKLSVDDNVYSVLMIGVDTISRLNGQRQLNQTLKTLQDFYKPLDFVGYNKVGENTFPNLIPLLTGLTPEQLTEIQCWEAKNYKKDESGDDYLDNCKFLWNYYQQIGYLTYLAEDWPSASTFNYLKPGFKYEPTAFYGRPFTLAREHLVYPKWHAPGCASCHLDKPLVEVDLANLRAFIENNTNKLPYLAIHWFNCPQHDDLNGASQVDYAFEKFFRELAIKLQLDRTFVIFFSDHGYRWNDFVSTRVGHYESSLPLLLIAPPPVFIERHQELYENLKSHQNSLLTPFDLFKTLIDLKDLSSGGRKSMTRDKRQQQFQPDPADLAANREITILPEGPALNSTITTKTPNKPEVTDANTRVKQLKPIDGTRFKQNFTILSLFDRHTPEQLNRGCIDAGIPDNYCVCHQFQAVKTDSLDVLGAAYYLVYAHLGALLKDHINICHPLNLERIHSAEKYNFTSSPSAKGKTRRKREPAKLVDQSGPNRLTSAKPAAKQHLHDVDDDQNRHNYLPQLEYSITFSTKPGSGLFNEVVRYYGTNMTSCKLEVEKTRKVIEDDWAKEADKHESVMTMNDVCDFSVHSASISRFNLYKDQSKCVEKGTELRKICYCRDKSE